MKIKRSLIYFDVENKNGRIYKKEDVMLKVEEFIAKKLKHGVAYGELGHPECVDISFRNVSHTIENIYEKKNVLYADVTILDTPKGKILKKNINNFVFSPRASGIVEEDKSVKIKYLHTFDAILKSDDSFVDFRKDKIIKFSVWQRIKNWINDKFDM